MNPIKILYFLLILQFSFSQSQSGISADSLFSYINKLGSDDMQGRAVGSEGIEKAARFIENKLSRWSLKPIGNNNTFRQSVPMHGSKALENSELILYFEKYQDTLSINKDYILIKSGAATRISHELPLVFAGYGIVAPEYDYNDYRDLDVAGKIVVLLEGEPYSSQDQTYFLGREKTIHGYTESKIRTAISRGAAGSVFISSINNKPANWQKKIREYAFEDVSLPGRVTSHLSLFLSPEYSRKIFNDLDNSLNIISKQAENHSLEYFSLNKKLTFKGRFSQREFVSYNLAAMLEGSDPDLKNSFVLLTAHYDHIGIGPVMNGDSIYNGVLDNAVGSSVLLELARVFSERDYQPKRSVIFLFLTGEEKGVLGSRYYVQHPLKPLYQSVVNINIDGLAAIGEFKEIYAVGSKYSDLAVLLSDFAAEKGLMFSKLPDFFSENEAFARSDQISFAQAGIPSILILEGLKHSGFSEQEIYSKYKKWMNEKYHSPFDDLNQPLSYKSIRKYTELLFGFSNRIANRSYEPAWNPGAPFINARLRSIAEKR